MESEDTDLIIRLFRFQQTKNTTLSTLSVGGRTWFVLEDALRKNKIKGKTAIPAGRYEIKLREEGRIHLNYLKKFGKNWHKGTLHIQDIPNYLWVLIHIGNDKEDTEGCPLTGKTWGRDKNGDFEVYNSTDAYKEFYPIPTNWLLSGKRVFIDIVNDMDLVYYD
ncbi:DUF5675 family protein [Bernardetia sp. Wsw4-3y2]|uniref:DUF5675 family protein n=1 Tax=Bernardetia sp. Wsw4-3y2 TaxID=3127471 RepID=UPI0030D108ED